MNAQRSFQNTFQNTRVEAAGIYESYFPDSDCVVMEAVGFK